MSITIRQMDLTDAAERDLLVRLTDAYAHDPMGGGEGLSDYARTHLADAVAAHPGLFAFVAEQDGEPVGHALCITGFSSFYAAPNCNLHDLSVLPKVRGQGLGRRLLQVVEAEARQRRLCKVVLEVRPDNAIGQALYGSEGFELSGLCGQAYLMMEKPLV
ncbi:GNAT family N-acetyltransferase [Aquitalea sp. S1-19]|uniref:GNAT family N-acetyltransferase n=1 Tax=Craterilacuibacter sinensis TaxID=2686017 RepID=A0A845BKW4_9NEIS|nr:GNAT family N-acetyltransferase [Craterilacuibacter sinensis]MCP9759158.1 GNAT family N-acetyltransferase [Aquitalea sp. S1-19]MXR35924.1 GNAT family N-acetyltransferase [Craterilacuibacter sinensis]